MQASPLAPVPFAFDAARHEYVNTVTGHTIPHITGDKAERGGADR